jgi:hypothetical protein
MHAEIRITHQFEESRNMTYELDCAGLPLAIRVFAPLPAMSAELPSPWRVEVTSEGKKAVVVSATAYSRALAFELVAERWRDSAASRECDVVDWQAIGTVLTAVRAL